MVLSVLVVLTAMSLPAVLRWQQGLPMEQAISILQLQLQETRIAAIRSGETRVLKLPGRHTAGRRYPESNAAPESPDWQFVLPARIRCQTQQSESADFMIICRPDGTVTECRLSLIDADGRATIFRLIDSQVQPVLFQQNAMIRHRAESGRVQSHPIPQMER